MKRYIAALILSLSLCGCASTAPHTGKTKSITSLRARNGQPYTMLSGDSYPKVVVTPEGKHATVMPPCGNLAVVVNSDGRHSTALINGSIATIITP